MFLNLFRCKATGIFEPQYRNQLLTTLSVTIISLSYGLNLGWLSPLIHLLKDPSQSPVNFVINVDEVSWVGSFVSIGGVAGALFFGYLFERVGRKTTIYLCAIPSLILWILVYFAQSVEYLYLARFCGGVTGSGAFILVPLFISEIASSEVRGRLGSMFCLSINIGIFMGFLITSHLQYHVVPFVMLTFPILYLCLATRYPETTQYLLKHGRNEEAKESFKFYQNAQTETMEEFLKFNSAFNELQTAVAQQKVKQMDIGWRDFCNKRAIQALTKGLVLLTLGVLAGPFAILNYMSSIFAVTKSVIDPNTNTIIIGLVQIIGSFSAITTVDHYGRKILLIISYSGMSVALALFGMYAFVAEETDIDLSAFSCWVPLTLLSFIIYIYSIGVYSVTFLVNIEIMPPTIRNSVQRVCVMVQTIVAFGLLKIFPIFLDTFGLSATMWFCASTCALGTFFTSVFIPETKGISLD